MIISPYDIVKQINDVLLDISIKPVQNIETIRHLLVNAKTEINNLRHHIESMSTLRPTSTDMMLLQDKSAEMTKMWNCANPHTTHTTHTPKWIEGKDE